MNLRAGRAPAAANVRILTHLAESVCDPAACACVHRALGQALEASLVVSRISMWR